MADVDVREAIIEEATRLFARKGYGATSIREVVEAAGVTKPTLYYHFGSKDGLFLEIVNMHLADLEAMVVEIVGGPGTVRERLGRFARNYLWGALEKKDAVRMLMSLQHPGERGRSRVDLMSMHLHAIALLGDLIREGVDRGEIRGDVDPNAAVLAFVGSVNMLCLTCLHGHQLDEDAVDGLLDLFFHGVGT